MIAPTLELSDSTDLLDPIDRIAEEFAHRLRDGQAPTVGEYVQRHPELADRLAAILPSVALMERWKRTEVSLAADAPPPPPERLGEFRILRELGRGGMGVVYEAYQESLGRSVALKVMHRALPDARRLGRFRREAEAVARLHHTHIVPIFGVGEHDGLSYYVMPMIPGHALDSLLADWRNDRPPDPALRWRLAARIGAEAAEALDHAHGLGILHRDIKPANLLLDQDQAVRVADFGLAKVAGQDDLTASGDVVGTLRYLAPECLEGHADSRSDVYSLGLTLYELLTLSPPFGELGPSQLLRRLHEGPPTRPRKLDPSIPRDLETIILVATARDPAHRYPTAARMADDLRRFLDDRPILARSATPAEHAFRWARRNRLSAALMAAAAASLALAAVVGWIGYATTNRALQGESRRRLEAEHATRRAEQNLALSLDVFEELFQKLADRDPGRPGPAAPPPRPNAGRTPPPGPPGMPPSEDEAELLRSMLTFYDRFAQFNATNPALEGQAASAHRRVGALYDLLGRDDDAQLAYDRATSMLEALAARFPDDPACKARLVQAYLAADPLEAPERDLPEIDRRLRLAIRITDDLADADLANTRDRARARASLGHLCRRLGRLDEAERHYLDSLELPAGDRPSAPARLDRVGTLEALASLRIGLGRSDDALGPLDLAAEELRSLSDSANERVPRRTASQRLDGVATLYELLGRSDDAQLVRLLASRSPSRLNEPPRPGAPSAPSRR